MDNTKWSAVVISKETHYKLKDLSKSYGVSMARVMEDLIKTTWDKLYLHRPPVIQQPSKDKKIFRSRA
jgi:hypothetical protein